MNAQVGKCDCEEYDAILGPFGIETRNDKGRDFFRPTNAFRLRIMNTCFQHEHYATHESSNEQKTKSMIDTIAVSQQLVSSVTDCAVTNDGIYSDHSAVRMSWNWRTNKPKFDTALSKGKPNHRKIQYDQNTNAIYNDFLRGRLSENSC